MEVTSAKPTLSKITVKDFKRIIEIDIDLAPITALVGCNGSGKSSVLQAAQLGIAVLQQAYIGDNSKGVPKFAQYVDYNSILFRPTESFLDLRRDERASAKLGYTICYEGVYVNEEGLQNAKLEVTIFRGRGATVSIKRSGDDMFAKELAKKSDPFAILASGITGIPTREEWRTKGFLDASAMHGDANLYLRSILDHLRQKDESWEKFLGAFRECFGNASVIVKHNKDTNRYIDIKIKQNETTFTLDMAASGMLQVIQILAYTYFYQPPLLLLDEPDIHLHPDGQWRLCKALRTVAETSNTRIVLATHSPQLVQDLSGYKRITKVVWIDGGEAISHSSVKPHYGILMGFGALSLGKKVFNTSAKRILLTEDADHEYIAILAAACGAPENLVIHSYYGCEGVSAARKLAQMISEFRPDAKVILHRDRDFRTEAEMNFEHELFCENNDIPDNVTEIFTPFNDVEHSFLQFDHLEEVFHDQLSRQDIEDIFAEGVEKGRELLTQEVYDAREVLLERLYSSERKMKKSAWRTCKMPNKAPDIFNFLPKESENFSFENCHGKRLLRIMHSGLHNRIKGPSKMVVKNIKMSTEHLRSPSWVNAFK